MPPSEANGHPDPAPDSHISVHALKVVVLLLLTLAVMRAVSWLLGWGIFRVRKRTGPRALLAANLLALAAFAGFLAWNAIPGELMDYAALAFGGVVYAVFFLIDLKWRPWGRQERAAPLSPPPVS